MRYDVTVIATFDGSKRSEPHDWGYWTIHAKDAQEASDQGVAKALDRRWPAALDALTILRTVVVREAIAGELWGGDGSCFEYLQVQQYPLTPPIIRGWRRG